MKKITSFALAVAMCLSLGCTLVSCNNEADTTVETQQTEANHTHTYGEWQKDATDHWKVCECGTVSDKAKHTWQSETLISTTTTLEGKIKHTCTTCGATKEETVPSLVGTSVTEEQWKAIFNAINFTDDNMISATFENATAKIFYLSSSGNSNYEVWKFNSKGAANYEIDEANAEIDVTDGYYCEYSEEQYYQYEYDNGTKTWSKYLTDSKSHTYLYDDYLFTNLRSYYSSFSYNETENAYEATNLTFRMNEFINEDDEITFKSIKIKFVDGKIAYYAYELDADWAKENYLPSAFSMDIYDYGTTTVEFPEATVIENPYSKK